MIDRNHAVPWHKDISFLQAVSGACHHAEVSGTFEQHQSAWMADVDDRNAIDFDSTGLS